MELILSIVFALFILVTVIQLFFYLVVFSRFAFKKLNKKPSDRKVPVSVVICAKNELENLRKNLPLILEQDYPDFEVVLVNDCSWDGSEQFLEEFAPNYPNLKVLTLKEQEKYPHGKKFALTLGIKAAKNEILLLTDADCAPASKDWISAMQSKYDPNTEIVLGYSPYHGDTNFLSKFIRFETFLTALQYFSFTILKMPYMGVGRNISYKKSLFFKHKGFASHNHIISGDDDLFVNEAATPTNVKFEIRPESFMVTEPKKHLGDWMKQKKRHLSTGKHYKPKHKLILGLFTGSHFLFFLSAIFLLIMGFQPVWIGILFGVRFLVQGVVFFFSMKKLKETSVFLLYPVFDFLYIPYYLVVGIKALLYKQKTWMY